MRWTFLWPERFRLMGATGTEQQAATYVCTTTVQQRITINRLVSQMRVPLAACRKPAGKLWQLCKVLYVFEHKMQYILIHAAFTRIVVFRHIGNVPPMIS